MKQLLKVLMLILVLVLSISVMVACNDDGAGNTDGSGDGAGTEEEEGDVNGKFTVTFKFIDKEGKKLEDVDGYSDANQKNIEYGKEARDKFSNQVQLFDEYVIIGWNRDEAAAKAGTVDENALKNIKKDITVYSVVRAKEMKTVTFYEPNGTTVAGTLQLLEGAALGRETPRPTVTGQYFMKWEFMKNDEAGKTDSNEGCIYGNCSFKAIMGYTDGTIGKTASTIALDGRKDPAYETSNTYLALNNKKTANNNKFGDTNAYADPSEVKADTWMVWDGAYVYLLIEVYDTSLTARSEAYAKSGADAWCNDSIELWYSFEQDSTLTKNSTRVGLAASGDRKVDGDGKYALPRSVYGTTVTGIGGGRSTHFEEIKYAVRNYLVEKEKGTAGDTTGLDKDGVTAPSYVIEFKIPAKPEAEADMDFAFEDWDGAKEKALNGKDLEEFKATGRLYGKDASENHISAYAFTKVDPLQNGDYVRFCLQINDLAISQKDLGTKYYDYWTLAELQAIDTSFTQAAYDDCKTKLFELKDGKVKAASTSGKFTAAGATQYDITQYLMFSLGGDAEGSYNVASYKRDLTDHTKNIMLDKDNNVYTRKTTVTE